jgi:anti-anti-sigma factor
MDDTLRVEVQRLEDGAVITVIGEVDTASMLTLRAALDDKTLDRQIVVDMSRVGFMDSSGLKVLLDQRIRMLENGGSLLIRDPSPAVRLLLDVTGLDQMLTEPDAAGSTVASEVKASSRQR